MKCDECGYTGLAEMVSTACHGGDDGYDVAVCPKCKVPMNDEEDEIMSGVGMFSEEWKMDFKDPKQKKAFDEGYKASERLNSDSTRAFNPYSVGSKEALAWNYGWNKQQ